MLDHAGVGADEPDGDATVAAVLLDVQENSDLLRADVGKVGQVEVQELHEGGDQSRQFVPDVDESP